MLGSMLRRLSLSKPIDSLITQFSQFHLTVKPPAMQTPTADFLGARNFLLKNRENYLKSHAEFQWPRMPHFNWALDYFDQIAKKNHKPALWFVGEVEKKCSFDEMYRRSNQVANFLLAKGVKRGDRVMLMLPNVPELWECMLAAIKIGAVIVPSSTLLSPADIVYRLKEASIQHVITSTTELEKLPQSHLFNGILVDGFEKGWHSYLSSQYYPEEFQTRSLTHSTDPLLLYFTSGTTSNPKLVIHTHESYPIGHLSTMYWLGVQPNDLHLNIATPGWAKHAWSSFFAPWNAQACIFLYAFPRFDTKKLLNILTQYPVTSLCAPPTVWRALRQEPLQNYKNIISLREALSAGEPLNAEVIADFKQRLEIDIREGYGQTEMTAAIGYCPGQEGIPGTMGYSLPGYLLALVDEKRNRVNEGELAVVLNPSPPVGIMQGYSDKEKTERAMQNGLYFTGDVVSRHEGNPLIFSFIGRKDNIFKSSGYQISPFKLESAMIKHPAVLEVAVVPILDPIKGAKPQAFVVLREGFKENPKLSKDIVDFANSQLAFFERINLIEFRKALPKTISGKIKHFELKEQKPSNGNRKKGG